MNKNVIGQTGKKKGLSAIFNNFSARVTEITGKPVAFLTAMFIIIAWAISGPVFGFSDTWQLVINTSTTIITFLMVFVIQQSQNKDTLALQLKLNELLASSRLASNSLVDIEDMTDEDLRVIKKYYIALAKLAKREGDIHASHSLDEAELNARKKNQARRSSQGARRRSRKPAAKDKQVDETLSKKEKREIKTTQQANRPDM